VIFLDSTSIEEKGKAALMLKPSAKRKRTALEKMVGEEEKSHMSEEMEDY
jgi:hypothetical protein